MAFIKGDWNAEELPGSSSYLDLTDNCDNNEIKVPCHPEVNYTASYTITMSKIEMLNLEENDTDQATLQNRILNQKKFEETVIEKTSTNSKSESMDGMENDLGAILIDNFDALTITDREGPTDTNVILNSHIDTSSGEKINNIGDSSRSDNGSDICLLDSSYTSQSEHSSFRSDDLNDTLETKISDSSFTSIDTSLEYYYFHNEPYHSSCSSDECCSSDSECEATVCFRNHVIRNQTSDRRFQIYENEHESNKKSRGIICCSVNRAPEPLTKKNKDLKIKQIRTEAYNPHDNLFENLKLPKKTISDKDVSEIASTSRALLTQAPLDIEPCTACVLHYRNLNDLSSREEWERPYSTNIVEYVIPNQKNEVLSRQSSFKRTEVYYGGCRKKGKVTARLVRLGVMARPRRKNGNYLYFSVNKSNSIYKKTKWMVEGIPPFGYYNAPQRRTFENDEEKGWWYDTSASYEEEDWKGDIILHSFFHPDSGSWQVESASSRV